MLGQGVLSDDVSWDLLLMEDVIDAIILTSLPIVFVKSYENRLTEIGITFRGLRKAVWIGLAGAVLLWTCVSLVDVGIKLIWGIGHTHPYIERLRHSGTSLDYFGTLVSIVVLAPISEEISVRGFAYTSLKRRYGKMTAIIVSSLIFTIMHFNLSSAVQLFVMSVGLTILFEYSASLIPVIIAHSIINFLSAEYGGIW